MSKGQSARLQAKGWQFGTVSEFLELTSKEAALIEIRLALSHQLKRRREAMMTQADLAKKIRSSQPQIAKAEASDGSISLDLLLRAMLATGATPKEIGSVVAAANPLLETAQGQAGA